MCCTKLLQRFVRRIFSSVRQHQIEPVKGWGVTSELTLTPPLTLTDTGTLHLTLRDTGKPKYIDCYATLITESTISVPPMIIGFLLCVRIYA